MGSSDQAAASYGQPKAGCSQLAVAKAGQKWLCTARLIASRQPRLGDDVWHVEVVVMVLRGGERGEVVVLGLEARLVAWSQAIGIVIAMVVCLRMRQGHACELWT